MLVWCPRWYKLLSFALPTLLAVLKVQRSYAKLWNRMFGPESELPQILQGMRMQAKTDLSTYMRCRGPGAARCRAEC